MRNTVHLILYTDKQTYTYTYRSYLLRWNYWTLKRKTPFFFSWKLYFSFYWIFNNKYYSKF
jgi:hypothetical protein